MSGKGRWLIRFLFLTAFFLLLILTRYPPPRFPTNFFFRFHPLVLVVSTLSSRKIIWILLPSLLFLVIIIGFKRNLFCEYVCPLGTILRTGTRLSPRKKKKARFPSIQTPIFIFFLVLALFSLPLAGIVDPLSLIVRSSVSLYSLLFLMTLFLTNFFFPGIWCGKLCPVRGLYKLLQHPQREFNSSRRRFLYALFSGLVVIPLIKGRRIPLLRPPGAKEEEEFISLCIRCGECMKVCLSGTIHPVLLEGGWENMFTPKIVPRKAPCELCFSCGKVCPTGSIRRDVQLKEVKIGTACIERNRCLVWDRNISCLICLEYCPLLAVYTDEKGRPIVDPNRCVGCGQCEYRCPVEGEAAIRVIPRM